MTATVNTSYVVAGSRKWSRSVFQKHLASLPGNWRFVADNGSLTALLSAAFSPRYIFFLHWSAVVPKELHERYECVCFHMTDLPYGRGGSPLQNLIVRGHRETMLTAFRMVSELDAGPVYFKEPLSLEGAAEEVYLRAGQVSADMIYRIIQQEPIPKAQVGDPVVFSRRKPKESSIPASLKNLLGLYDFIRMLDADGYPHAFIEHGSFRFHFTRATLRDGHITADVRITSTNDESA